MNQNPGNHVPTATPDQLALEQPGFWFRKIYYVNGVPLFTVDADDVPIPLNNDTPGSCLLGCSD